MWKTPHPVILATIILVSAAAGGLVTHQLTPPQEQTPQEHVVVTETIFQNTTIREGVDTPPNTIIEQNQTDYCDTPQMDIDINDGPWYAGMPITFAINYTGCLQYWSALYNDGTEQVWPENHTDTHTFPRPGTYKIWTGARFQNDIWITNWVFIHIKQFADPETEPNHDNWIKYTEHPLYPVENITLYPYLDNGAGWYERTYEQMSYTLWWYGVENATYLNGQGSAVMHVKATYNGWPIVTEGYDAWGRAWIVKLDGATNPSNQIPPCKNGYNGELLMRTIVEQPILPGSWGFTTRPLGCGQDIFTPGQTQIGFCIEWDGILTPAWTPYHGPAGKGYLFDECDHFHLETI